MADEPTRSNENAQGAAGETQAAPRLSIIAQYVKDLSFENPRAANLMQPRTTRPAISVRVDVGSRDLGEQRYEVELRVNVDAKSGEETDFVVELSYAGLFEIANVPAQALTPLVMIEGPRLLFPFARRIVADATRDGGLPPLMIDPIDFAALFRRRLEEARRQSEVSSGTPPVGHA